MKQIFFGLFLMVIVSACSLEGGIYEAEQSTNHPMNSGQENSGGASMDSVSGSHGTATISSGMISGMDKKFLTGMLMPNIEVASGVTVSGESVLHKSNSKNSPVCIVQVCIDTSYPYFIVGDEYIQVSYSGSSEVPEKYFATKLPSKSDETHDYDMSDFSEGGAQIVRIKKDFSSGSLSMMEVMSSSSIEESLIPNTDLYISKKASSGCAGKSIQQVFLKQDGTHTTFDASHNEYPKILQVGNLQFQSYWTEEYISYGWKAINRDGVEYIPDEFSIHDDVGKKLEEYITQKGDLTYAYSIQFKEYPGIAFFYKTNLLSSDRIFSFTKELGDTSTFLDTRGNIVGMNATKYILSFYEQQGDTEPLIANRTLMKKGDTDYTRIIAKNVTTKMLPIFRVVPLDGRGKYILYTTDAYESTTMAELCKPVVYVYDRSGKKNTLTVGFPRGGEFTKLIPDFSYGHTWDFLSNPQSTIHVSNQSFEYLYYSAKVPHYTYNDRGWQVYGKDIVSFLEQKLAYIGFTEKEKNDFIQYWKHEFDSDTLYFVSFKFDTDIQEYVTLNFQRKPEALIRVLLEAYPILDTPNIQFLWPNVGDRFDAILLKKFTRTHRYDVLEWGGTVQKNKESRVTVY